MEVQQAVFLVGGQGTRLGDLVRAVPKPLLSVAGKPFVSYLIDAAIARGFRDFVFLAGHHGEQVSHMHEQYSEIGHALRDKNARFSVVREPAPAGTGGALLQAREHLDEEFLLLNGDSMFDFDWRDLTTLETPDGWLGRLALRQVADTARYGLVDLDGNKIREFSTSDSANPGLINGGVYLLRRDILDRIERTPSSLERDVLPRLAEEGRLYGRAYDGYFIDIGVPEDLARAEKEMKSRRPTICRSA